MVVRFFRVEIKGTNQDSLNTIKNWFDTKIENNDLSLEATSNSKVYDTPFEEEYIFVCNLYINTSVNFNKYKDIIVNKFQTYDKTGLTSAKVIQYDNCDHDEDVHTPCQPITRMEWTV